MGNRCGRGFRPSVRPSLLLFCLWERFGFEFERVRLFANARGVSIGRIRGGGGDDDDDDDY